MKALIVEDEIIAVNRLKRMIHEYDAEIEIIEVIDSVLDCVNFLCDHDPDLIFMDVQLSDGTCFEIFDGIEVNIPVIFITAYDKYTLKAFKVNSIDYLLKPIHPKDLSAALEKFKKIKPANSKTIEQTLISIERDQNHYKYRFLVRSGNGFISLEVKDIAYILSENKVSYIVTHDGKKNFVSKSLEQLQQLLNPLEFQRINRNFIVSNKAIKRIKPCFNNRLLLEVTPPLRQDVFVNRTYLKGFKVWFDM